MLIFLEGKIVVKELESQDFYIISLCINAMHSTCTETLVRINIRARDFWFLHPIYRGNNMAVSILPVSATLSEQTD